MARNLKQVRTVQPMQNKNNLPDIRAVHTAGTRRIQRMTMEPLVRDGIHTRIAGSCSLFAGWVETCLPVVDVVTGQ